MNEAVGAVMELGSVADWVGAVGGAAGALIAMVFYAMDRWRHAQDKREAVARDVADQNMISSEFKGILEDSLETLTSAQESDRTDAAWRYYNGILRNQATRMRELMIALDRRSQLSIKIGNAAHILAFSNLPLVHMDLWEEKAAEAEARMRPIYEDTEFRL